MFLFIPLIFILSSIGGIFFIVWRKLPHLKELAKAESSNGVPTENGWHSLVCDLCPEVWNWARGIKVKDYKEMWLVETEKLLRRLRVASMKMDRFSDSLIKKIRRSAYSSGSSTYAEKEEEKNGNNKPTALIQENNREELKRNEQRLILEIAKNPKNASLYEELGDLYTKTGGYRDAKESYEAAIELSPQNESLKQKLSSALEQLNPPK